MNYSSFSIVIPLYNKEEHIVRTLKSLQAQTFQNFEIVVINDGSTDKSISMVESMDMENLKIINQVNKGVSAARNLGIKAAKYPWIVLLDGDDELKPEYLRIIHQMMKAYPNEKVFATGYVFTYKNGSNKLPQFHGVPFKGTYGILPNYFKSLIKGKSVMTGSSVCIHREVFNVAGFFPVGYKRGEDLDMWFRIALYFKIVFYNAPLVIYHKDITESATTFIDDVRSTFPYYRWFKAPQNKFNLPYQNRYTLHRLAKAIYIMSQHRKLHHIFKFFFR